MIPNPQYRYEGSELLRLGEELKNYNAAIADIIVRASPPSAKMLDFGAGFGTLTEAVAARLGKPECVEPDPRQREVLEGAGFTCYATIEAIPQESYDLVYSSNVLEHIEDDLEALRRLLRVLRPNGKIVLYLPAFQSLYSAVDAAIGHYRRYDARMIAELLRDAGFVPERVYYVDVLGFIMGWIFKRIANNVGSVNSNTMRIYDRLIFPITRMIERFVRPPFGKNVVAIASRPAVVGPGTL